MTNKISVVTPPDDLYTQGFRILAVDLSVDQLNELSKSVQVIEQDCETIVYVWKQGFKVDWLLDKIYKANAIFFNADSQDQTLVGFLAAQKKSAYFGTLRSINEVNKSVVYDHQQCSNFLNYHLGLYE